MNYYKFLFVFLFISTFATSMSFSQTGTVTYDVKFSEPPKSDRLINVGKEIELMEFTLNYDKEKSHFKKEKNIPINELFAVPATIMMGALSDYYQTSKDKKSLHNKTIANKTYQVDRSYKMQDWVLTNETIEINNYTCYKAILTRYNKRSESNWEIVAWYTPEIPASYGPIGYGGLPGLILQLQYKKFIYNAKMIVLNPDETVVEDIKEGKLISVDEVVRLMRANRKVTED